MDSELERLTRAFLDEFHAAQAWDSEFTPSPHSPVPALEALVALGEAAAPVLSMFARDTSRDLRWWGVVGLGQLGPRAGESGLSILESLIDDDFVGGRAVEAIEQVDGERFWALGLHRFSDPVGTLTQRHKAAGTGAQWLLRILSETGERSAVAALQGLGTVRADEAALLDVLRHALMSSFAGVRAEAALILSKLPSASPVEAVIEAMATAQKVTSIENIAWHPDSQILVDLLTRQGGVESLVDLLERRRCAGLITPPEPLRALLEKTLRFPKRPWRFEQHEVHAAARCVLQLGDEHLVPSLVEAVEPENEGYAWDALKEALRHFGEKSVAALQVRKVSAEPARAERIDWMLSALKINALDLDWADADFVKGSIDHTTSCAFKIYGSVLREKPSAHAAFQLAWIDRAFGVRMLPARLEWIRSMGLRDDALLNELASPVVSLEGWRHSWRKCDAASAPKALAAGLPGLAFTGSREPAHTAAAKQHVARVITACAAPRA